MSTVEKDILGNELSVEQSNFFKNSVIRDNGKLLVLYHGSPSMNITSFRCNADDRPEAFFTLSSTYADAYSKWEEDDIGRVYEVYLNITKLFDVLDPKCNELACKILNKDFVDTRTIVDTDILFKYLKAHPELGYDGILAGEELSDSYIKKYGEQSNLSYVPFFANQIKLISNKKPTLSSSIVESIDKEKINDFVNTLVLTDELILTSTFIIDNGKFIDFNQSAKDNLLIKTDSEKYLNYITHTDFYSKLKELNLIDTNYETLDIVDDMHWIRLNGKDGFIQLPKDKLTEEQYNSLAAWLDLYSFKNDSIDVGVNNDSDEITYYFDGELDSDYIISRIKYFYNTGILKEDLNENIELHDNLNPKLWEGNTLLPEVKDKIIEIAQAFKTQLQKDGVDLKITDIYLLGSNANYNYNDDSDLDIHLIADESDDCIKQHLQLIYSAYKTLFNNKYNITIKGINVELYVENKDNLTNISSGVYSLKSGWIKSPTRYLIPEINQNDLDSKIQDWENKYFKITENPTIESIDTFLDDIYKIRQESITKQGEFGLDNLTFKEIRRLGYLDDLKDLKNKLVAQNLSL